MTKRVLRGVLVVFGTVLVVAVAFVAMLVLGTAVAQPVIGKSAPADPRNFDPSVGERFAAQDESRWIEIFDELTQDQVARIGMDVGPRSVREDLRGGRARNLG